MPGFEALLLIALVAGAALGAGALYAALARRPPSPAGEALAAGDFSTARSVASGAERSEILAGAIAAKHLLDLDTAEARLAALLETDPGDGEAWLERGLVAAYGGRWEDAVRALDRAVATRSDLLEPVTLHRAWIALASGDPERARRLFEDVEAPLETKLRTDIGGGDPLFAEWFLQASRLWRSAGDTDRAEWAWQEGIEAAPESQLPKRI